MIMRFKDKDRFFECKADNVEEIFQGVQDGLIAMGYHVSTSKSLIRDLVKELIKLKDE